jgi:hypothetical protein
VSKQIFLFAVYETDFLAKYSGLPLSLKIESLCGLVLRVPGYRSRGPGSIPGATTFSEK